MEFQAYQQQPTSVPFFLFCAKGRTGWSCQRLDETKGHTFESTEQFRKCQPNASYKKMSRLPFVTLSLLVHFFLFFLSSAFSFLLPFFS